MLFFLVVRKHLRFRAENKKAVVLRKRVRNRLEALVQLYDAQHSPFAGDTVTDTDGKFAMQVGQNVYYLW